MRSSALLVAESTRARETGDVICADPGSSACPALLAPKGHLPTAPGEPYLGSGCKSADRVADQHKDPRVGFRQPDAIASDGTHVWVANNDGNSVTELNASTGALVKVISGSRYEFNDPDAIASDGTHVWVANDDGNSVTELNASTGGLVKVISGSSYGFNDPDAIASDGTHVWVANTRRQLGHRAQRQDGRAWSR